MESLYIRLHSLLKPPREQYLSCPISLSQARAYCLAFPSMAFFNQFRCVPPAPTPAWALAPTPASTNTRKVIGGNAIGATFTNGNFASVDLNGANTQGGNATSGDVPYSIFTGGNATGSNFTNTNFANADLNGANTQGSNATGSNFTNANFANADLNGANTQGSNATGSNFTNANFVDAKLNGANTTSSNAIHSS